MNEDYDYEEDYYDDDYDEDYDDRSEEVKKLNSTPVIMDVAFSLAKCESYILDHDPLQDIAFAMVFNHGDKDYFWYRQSQPCYGELRHYTPEEYRPHDLHDPFPLEGTPKMVAVPLGRSGATPMSHNSFVLAIFDKSVSPWKRGLGEIHFVYDKDGYIAGIIQTNGDFDPTVFVNALITYRNNVGTYSNYGKGDFFMKLKSMLPKVQTRALLLMTIGIPLYRKPGTPPTILLQKIQLSNYTHNHGFDIRKWMNQETVDLTGGTWAERKAYNRAELQNIFGVENTHYSELQVAFQIKTSQNVEAAETAESLTKLAQVIDSIAA